MPAGAPFAARSAGGLRPASGEVHVWPVWLDRPEPSVRRLYRVLSPDERARADRLIRLRHRERFIAARGLLRCILARYAGIEPARLRFYYGPEGKPELVPEPGAPRLAFNLSHSRAVALVAVTPGEEVGVDVEYNAKTIDHAGIALRFFSPRESAELEGLPSGERVAAFFRCWTRKEALLKARGIGIVRGLREFEVPLAPGEPPRILAPGGRTATRTDWSLHDLPAPPGYTAALAVAHPAPRIRLRGEGSGQ